MDSPTFTVHVDSSRHLTHRIQLSAQLAAASGAHLVGVASTYLPAPAYLACIGAQAEALLAAYRERMRQRMEQDFQRFEAVAAGAGLRYWEPRVVDIDIAIALCLQARYSDLLVVGKADPDDADEASRTLAEFVLMHSGRPVLVCPYADAPAFAGKRCLVAWDGSVEAMRAISGALFALRAAPQTILAVLNPRISWDGHGEDPGADMALYLARHGVTVEVDCRHVARKSEIGEALLEQAEAMHADLIVAGAYGHAHLRQILLGGVTQTLLENMTVPLLLAH